MRNRYQAADEAAEEDSEAARHIPELKPCEYPKCPERGLSVYEHFLCWDHSGEVCAFLTTAVPRDLSAEPGAGWTGRCAAVGNWLESKRPARKLAMGGR